MLQLTKLLHQQVPGEAGRCPEQAQQLEILLQYPLSTLNSVMPGITVQMLWLSSTRLKAQLDAATVPQYTRGDCS